MRPLFFLLAVFLSFLIPKNREEEQEDEEDFIDELLFLWDDDEPYVHQKKPELNSRHIQ